MNIKLLCTTDKLLLLSAVMLLSLPACVLTSSPMRETRTIPDLMDYFISCGLKVEKVQPTVYQTLQASDGCAFWIEGAKMEVYIYDISVRKEKERLEKIKKNHKIKVLYLDIPVVVNGGMVLLTYSQHPNAAKIARAFRKFPLGYRKN
jgi:hypothetical protein